MLQLQFVLNKLKTMELYVIIKKAIFRTFVQVMDPLTLLPNSLSPQTGQKLTWFQCYGQFNLGRPPIKSTDCVGWSGLKRRSKIVLNTPTLNTLMPTPLVDCARHIIIKWTEMVAI